MNCPYGRTVVVLPMKTSDTLIFLDAGSVDYGDVSFRAFQRLGRFKAFYKTSPAQIIQRSKNATHILTNKCVFSETVLKALPKLRGIHLSATGFNNIDIEAARQLGIAVTNVRGYSTESVVQMTFAFILNLATGMMDLHKAARDGRWSRAPFFTLSNARISEVCGKTLGLIGYGTIGKRVAEVARVFGMKVQAAAIPGRKYGAGPRRISLDKLARTSDYISIHAPLTPLTKGLIDARFLRKMKKDACLINMARGGIVVEGDLIQALKTRKIAGAALDVLVTEPPRANDPVLKAPRLILTPHAAWASIEARRRVVGEMALNIRAFQEGRQRSRVV